MENESTKMSLIDAFNGAMLHTVRYQLDLPRLKLEDLPPFEMHYHTLTNVDSATSRGAKMGHYIVAKYREFTDDLYMKGKRSAYTHLCKEKTRETVQPVRGPSTRYKNSVRQQQVYASTLRKH